MSSRRSRGSWFGTSAPPDEEETRLVFLPTQSRNRFPGGYYGSCESVSLVGRKYQRRSGDTSTRNWRRMGALLPKPEVQPFRKVDVLQQGVTVSREQHGMANNRVITSKYNFVTFVPRSLFEQFRRIANMYFLVMSILMVIGTYTDLFTSPLEPYSTLLPLCGVLLVTMVKDGLEDLKRHRSDNKVRARPRFL